MDELHLEGVSDEPLYNIGIVSKMTGVPVATLRVWERRYGFPNSVRTSGGHRLCSEREVLRLRWVKARVDEGMQTGQAIRALQHLEQQGRTEDIFPVPAAKPRPMDGSLPAFQERLTELLLAGDLAGSDQLLGEVLALYPLEELIAHVISPTLRDIGSAWLDGKISVASEHLATHFLRHHLLMWMMNAPTPYDGVPPIILACAPEEWHEGSLLIMGVLMRRKRWPVAYLGQNVPLKDVVDLARKLKAPALVFVAMMEAGAQSLITWRDLWPEAAESGRPIVSYGGQIFNDAPQWRERMGGIFLGETLLDGADKLDSLLRGAVRVRG